MLWVGFPLEKVKYIIFSFLHFGIEARGSGGAKLSSATQHAMSPQFGEKWGTECLNIRLPVSCCTRDTA